MVVFLLPLILGSAVIVLANNLVFEPGSAHQGVYRYQLEKLEATSSVDTVFVGDSSLGNAIDAAHFSELTPGQSVNLALTGTHGYAGSYNMLKKALQASPELQNVVVFQTLDMITRPVSYQGYLYTIGSAGDLLELGLPGIRRLFSVAQGAFTMDNALASLADRPPYTIENDSIEQAARTAALSDEPPSIAKIDADKEEFLIRLIRFCEARELNCIYAHGPIWEELGIAAGEYIEFVGERLMELGLPVVGPILIDTARLGNAVDHVAPAFKRQFTEGVFSKSGTVPCRGREQAIGPSASSIGTDQETRRHPKGRSP